MNFIFNQTVKFKYHKQIHKKAGTRGFFLKKKKKPVTVTGLRQSECLINLSTKTKKQLNCQDFSLMKKVKMIEPDSQHFMIHGEFIDIELITRKCKKSQVADYFFWCQQSTPIIKQF